LTLDSGSEAHAQEERTDGHPGTPERKERRSRDRYGRDRRERNASPDSAATDAVNATPAEDSSADQAHQADVPATRSYFDRAVAPATTSTSASSQPDESSSVSTDAATSPARLPKVQTYELPLASLIEVAEGSGLKWVNSDPEKIAQAQAAIAAEPKPVHIPRERPPAVVIDEGPLVLVETRKDLSNLNLPF
jgi:ribonuclease E